MLLLIFFALTGAKRETGGVLYMIVPKDSKKEVFVPSHATKKFLVPVIEFLQSKISIERNSDVTANSLCAAAEPNSVFCEFAVQLFAPLTEF